MKIFSLRFNEDEMAILTLYISTAKPLVQSVVYTYRKVVK